MMQSLSNLLNAGKELAKVVERYDNGEAMTFELGNALRDYQRCEKEYNLDIFDDHTESEKAKMSAKHYTKEQKVTFMVRFEMERGGADNSEAWMTTKDENVNYWFNYYQEMVNKEG